MGFRELYVKAMEAYENGDYVAARKDFEDLVAQGHAFADVLNKLGFIMSMKGEYEKAVVHLKKALEINPRYTEAAVNLAFVYGELGRYDDARQVRESVRQNLVDTKGRKSVDPFVLGKIANLHGELGERYAELEWFGEAIDEYKKAVHLRPAFVDLRTRLAVLEREQGRIEDAIEHLTQSLLENPNYVPAYIQLGMTYFVMGEHDLARKQWETVVAKDPDNTVAKAYINMVNKKVGS